MLRLKLQQFAEPAAGDGATSGGETGADISATGADNTVNESGGAGNQSESNQASNPSTDDMNAEIARLKAEMAKQKAALDKATHEASENKKAMNEAQKALKAKMTQEEIDEAAKKEAADKAAQELEDLRRQVAKGNTVKTVMGKLGLDEESAGNLADHLYGAADIDNALLEIQKAWQIREAALRKEFGKVTAPGAGADSNSPEAQAIRRAQEIGKSRNALNAQAQKALDAYIR